MLEEEEKINNVKWYLILRMTESSITMNILAEMDHLQLYPIHFLIECPERTVWRIQRMPQFRAVNTRCKYPILNGQIYSNSNSGFIRQLLIEKKNGAWCSLTTLNGSVRFQAIKLSWIFLTCISECITYVGFIFCNSHLCVKHMPHLSCV